MKRRTRLIAGIFSLVAMTFSFVETASASMCAPDMDSHASASAAAEQGQIYELILSVLPQLEHEAGGENEQDCPFSPAAAQACAGAASLPASVVDGLGPSTESATPVIADSTQHELLLRNALFRPPRA